MLLSLFALLAVGPSTARHDLAGEYRPLASLRATAAPPIAIRAARLLDVRSGRISSNAMVVVQDGKIIQVGGAAPAGAEVIDLGDVTLMPGLIDAHTHLTFEIAPGF